MIANDLEHARTREQEERRAAAAAADVTARYAHRQLAERYADRIWGGRDELSSTPSRP